MGYVKLAWAFIEAVPSWLWAAICVIQISLLIALQVNLNFTEVKLAKTTTELAIFKLEQASADNRSLLNMAERYATLSTELDAIRNKKDQNATKLQTARTQLADRDERLRIANTDLERDLIAAEHGRTVEYAVGVERYYRACAKEYIDLGLGRGGAAQASDAAYEQKARADAIVRALPPVKPIPPTK